MKKYLLFTAFLLTFYFNLQAQQYRFAWLTDMHIGFSGASESLANAVADINKKEFQFTIVTGDLTEKGRSGELDECRQILDSLKNEYYIIPGNHDTKWSESGCTKFTELWKKDKFNFVYQGIRFIGLNSGIIMRGGGGHITPEDIEWFQDALNKSGKEEELVVITHHPLDGDIDNWFEIINKLIGRNVIALLYGHGHENRISEIAGLPALMSRSTLTDKQGKWGYTSITVTADSLLFFEENGDSLTAFLGSFPRHLKYEIPQTDTADFINYNADVIAQLNLKKTLSARLCVYNNLVFSASVDGIVSCINQQGKTLWTYNTGANIISKPAAAGDVLAVATVQGDLLTIDIETGKLLQTLGVNEAVTSQLAIKRIKVQNDTIDAVFAGTASGALNCYELNSLTEIWSNTDAKGMIETEPLIVDSKVIYGSWDSYLYCLELETGRIIWKYTGNKNFYYSPAACVPVTDGKSVFIATPDKFVTSVDLLIGKANWRKKDSDCWESISLSNDKKNIFIKSINDKFYIIAAKDGKVVKSINCKFGTDTMPVEPLEIDGNILFGTKTGLVYMLDKKYKLIPLFFMGTSRVMTVNQVSEDTFAAANMDGKIVVFKIKASDAE